MVDTFLSRTMLPQVNLLAQQSMMAAGDGGLAGAGAATAPSGLNASTLQTIPSAYLNKRMGSTTALAAETCVVARLAACVVCARLLLRARYTCCPTLYA